MTEIGFSGTRKGMTSRQLDVVTELLRTRRPAWLHHGCCLGADEQTHGIARALGIAIEGHPPSDSRLRAFLECDRLHKPVAYLRRNRAIVEAVSELIAAPLGVKEELRSGTWSTVRLARMKQRLVTIVWPDGSLELTP